ncbi:GatB/YqeY domain-containing protein [Desulfosarcina sp. OttesenSCG-928-A07]|nr:GatB/YqeY domain-containing protein [Desulfosarcina sp. OttesenSCG-928-G17]MDL2329708.1 GatB/YqeY domain-containing protein [Desulfosarcina sp. OttesenSCG-928-A07]
MTLQDTLKSDLTIAMKNKDEDKKSALRIVIGEMARLDKKQFDDDEVIRVLKKLIKSEKELLEKSGQTGASPFIAVLEAYLPKPATDAEIRQWIAENIDFSAYKNAMQVMGPIMAHFGQRADGNQVKEILKAQQS